MNLHDWLFPNARLARGHGSSTPLTRWRRTSFDWDKNKIAKPLHAVGFAIKFTNKSTFTSICFVIKFTNKSTFTSICFVIQLGLFGLWVRITLYPNPQSLRDRFFGADPEGRTRKSRTHRAMPRMVEPDPKALMRPSYSRESPPNAGAFFFCDATTPYKSPIYLPFQQFCLRFV